MAPEGPDVEKQEPKSPKSSSSMTDPELRYVTSYLIIQFSECRWTPLTHLFTSETLHSNGHATAAQTNQPLHPHLHFEYYVTRQKRFWHRLSGKDRPRVPGWIESGKNIVTSSCKSRSVHFPHIIY